jgi:hypothetical protein
MMNRLNARNLPAWVVGAVIAAGIALGLAAHAQQDEKLGYQDTPLLPGGKWHVHDGLRPQPRIIDPGTPSTQDTSGKAPSDAVVLFDGTDLSKWQKDNGQPAAWKVENGYMEITPKGGSLATKERFGDCQLHIEWSAPVPAKGSGQGRGNSGVMFYGLYEVQVLDSYGNKTYPDGQAASMYGQYPPLVNASRKPGEWQTFDIIFTAPKFADGKLVSPGYQTILHNGVLMHNHSEILGATVHRALAKYQSHGGRGPLVLQDHGQPVRYRNIWLRELKGYDEP